MKIIEKIERWKCENEGAPFYSFEYFPPKTDAGLLNLYDRLDRMAAFNPLWIDVTWRDGGRSSERSIEICSNAIKYHGLEPLLHITCTNISKQQLDVILKQCLEQNIVNILALRGDPLLTQSKWEPTPDGFEHAEELVRYMKEKFGNQFCICVAGYPEGHLECPNKDDDLFFLKRKVDAGADFVITQMFYDVEEFKNFQNKCTEIGITKPIIPGILPIQSYASFSKTIKYCKPNVPKDILDEIEAVKNDDQKVKELGVILGIKMCKDLINLGVEGLHFYTLNLENTIIRIIEGLNLQYTQRELPWRPLAGRKEDVRPIFWSNRPRSYVYRTSSWDDFPNGRWGNPDSPAFGENFSSTIFGPKERSPEARKAMWCSQLTSIEDISEVFSKYIKNNDCVTRLPWCQDQPRAETFLIQKQLIQLNHFGLLTINSQPRVNCSPSTDPIFGWGPKDGYVFQKAYIEFFCSAESLKAILPEIKDDLDLNYMAMNLSGVFHTNCQNATNALTWGVFKGQEIKQPTVADYTAFLHWKPEAFDLWVSDWASLYDEQSPSYKLIKKIHDNWYLVNIVDNNFVTGDLFGKLVNICKKKSISLS